MKPEIDETLVYGFLAIHYKEFIKFYEKFSDLPLPKTQGNNDEP